ncbi:MAG: hypothetical protein ACT6QS_07330 [Flavobacteriales bacterium]
MMMKKSLVLLTVVFSCLVPAIYGQDLQKDWYELYRLLTDPGSLEIRMQTHIRFVQDEERSQLEPMRMETHIRISNGMYYFKNNEYEMLINRKYVITVMYQENRMMVAGNAAEYLDKYRRIAIENTPFAFNNIEGIRTTYLGTEQDRRTYLVQGDDTEIREARISFAASGPGLKHVSYIYHPDSETGMKDMQIDFSIFDTNPVFPETAFSESAFFRVTSQGMVPAASFAGFQLITLNSYEK